MNNRTFWHIWSAVGLTVLVFVVFIYVFLPIEPFGNGFSLVSSQPQHGGDSVGDDDCSPRLIPVSGSITLYLYQPETLVYRMQPSAYTPEEPPTLAQLCREVELALDAPSLQPAFVMGANPGPLTVTLPPGTREHLDSIGPQMQAAYLHSLATTLLANHQPVFYLHLQVEGEPPAGRFSPMPLAIDERDYDGRFALAQQNEPEPLVMPWLPQHNFYTNYGLVPSDATADMLARYLQVLGNPGEAQSPQELDVAWILSRLVPYGAGASLGLYEFVFDDLEAMQQNGSGYQAKRLLFLAAGQDVYLAPQRVQAAAASIFGVELDFSAMQAAGANGDAGIWQIYNWHSQAGVIVPPYLTGATEPLPVVLSYEERQDSYLVQACFLETGLPLLNEDQAAQILEQERQSLYNQPIIEFVLHKGQNGAITFESSRYL